MTLIPATSEQLHRLVILMYERLCMEVEDIQKMNLKRMTETEAASMLLDYQEIPQARTHPLPNLLTDTVFGTPAPDAAPPHPAATVVPPPATYSPPAKRWNCYTCGVEFPSWPELRDHKLTAHNTATKVAAAPPPAASTTAAHTVAASIPGVSAAASTGTTWLPVGRYAVEVDGVWKFYRVTERESRYNRNQKYHWMTHQSGDNQLRVTQAERLRVEILVNADIKKAQQEYGQRLGMCGCCGRSLTDPVSIAYGIGPDCRAQRGWV